MPEPIFSSDLDELVGFVVFAAAVFSNVTWEQIDDETVEFAADRDAIASAIEEHFGEVPDDTLALLESAILHYTKVPCPSEAVLLFAHTAKHIMEGSYDMIVVEPGTVH
jgi:hypothetical protein